MCLHIPESPPNEKQRQNFQQRNYGEKNHSQEEITTYTLIDRADLLYYAFKKGKLNGNPEYRQKKYLCHHANLYIILSK